MLLILPHGLFKSLTKCDYFWISTANDDDFGVITLFCLFIGCNFDLMPWELHRPPSRSWAITAALPAWASHIMSHKWCVTASLWGETRSVNVSTFTKCECCLKKRAESKLETVTLTAALYTYRLISAILGRTWTASHVCISRFCKGRLSPGFKVLIEVVCTVVILRSLHLAFIFPVVTARFTLCTFELTLFYSPVLLALPPTLFSFHHLSQKKEKKEKPNHLGITSPQHIRKEMLLMLSLVCQIHRKTYCNQAKIG